MTQWFKNIISVAEDGEQFELSYTIDENIKWLRPLFVANSLSVLKKVKSRITTSPNNSTPCFTGIISELKEMKIDI